MRVEPNFHMTFVTISQYLICCSFVVLMFGGQTLTVVDKIER